MDADAVNDRGRMAHPTEDELVLYRYQEGQDAAAIARHLATCARCKADYAALDRVLGLLETDVPEPSPSYEREVWMRIAPRLADSRGGWSLRAWRDRLPAWRAAWLIPQLGLAAAIALLLAGSFAMDRTLGTSSPPPASLASSPAVATPVATARAVTGTRPGSPIGETRGGRDGVLMAAVEEHLQRSELMLTEFNNVDAHSGVDVDLTAQQAWAEDLVTENRLYRQSAAGAGRVQMATLLDDLERVLLEVAHAPASATPKELDRLRRQLDTQDVLFKVRVASAGLRAREDMAAVLVDPPLRSGSSGSGL